jgi:hypothetical protein
MGVLKFEECSGGIKLPEMPMTVIQPESTVVKYPVGVAYSPCSMLSPDSAVSPQIARLFLLNAD